LYPRDERAIVLEEKVVEEISVCLALTKQRPQFPWRLNESSMRSGIERG
jgi:hypothetical protein